MSQAKRKYLYLLLLLPFLALTITFELLPLATVFINSVQPEGASGFTLEHFQRIFSSLASQKAIINSIVVSIFSMLAGIIIAFIGAKAVSEVGSKFHNAFLTILNMTSNFAGVPLAFGFSLLLGNAGILVQLGRQYNIGFLADYNLNSVNGLILVYIYFQIPLATLLLLPAFDGIRKEWKEAASLLGARPITFWLRVGIPVLMPSVLGTMGVLFANALAAYATAYALMLNNFSLLPINISKSFVGDISQQVEYGSALSVVMMIIMIIGMGLLELGAKYMRKGRKP